MDQTAETNGGDGETRGPRAPALALSNAISRLHKQFVGRGPANVRTTLDDDLVVCVLEGCLTTDEQTLATTGRTDLVAARRTALQDSMRPTLVAAVRDITGRPVLSFMSSTDLEHDLHAEVFVLGPQHEPPRAS
ncbi:MAG TPA: DUF2294 domain-containing protein [Solirubrobacteraceae bacterium]|nr:DUF2294 domain-containing protein [Solirubrobacteraceae bacterium]